MGGKIAARAEVLKNRATPLYLLDISFWEVCKAVGHEKLVLDRLPLEWIRAAIPENLTVLSITPEIADASCQLAREGLKSEDPADQLICAAAKLHRLTLVTRDNAIIRWGGVSVLVY